MAEIKFKLEDINTFKILRSASITSQIPEAYEETYTRIFDEDEEEYTKYFDGVLLYNDTNAPVRSDFTQIFNAKDFFDMLHVDLNRLLAGRDIDIIINDTKITKEDTLIIDGNGNKYK